jgi:hypothetical protein
MPWCEHCARFLTPTSMDEEGTCPSCGRRVATAKPIDASNVDLKALAGEEDAKAPWHFKLLVVALVVYLAWRVIQMIGWLV